MSSLGQDITVRHRPATGGEAELPHGYNLFFMLLGDLMRKPMIFMTGAFKSGENDSVSLQELLIPSCVQVSTKRS